MDLVTFRQVSLNYGHSIIADKIDWILRSGERICLIGRNGEGKTTLLRLLQGKEQPDHGEVIISQTVVMSSLAQEVPQTITGTIYDVVALGVQAESHDVWQVQHLINELISKLDLSASARFEELSGGLKRRVLLAQALVCKPDILLLDEPTNHLDIEAIEWLEPFLSRYKGCLVFITHDRNFLRKVATRIVELDRGCLLDFEGSYDQFLVYKQSKLDHEARHNQLFDKRLQQEEVWIRQGIQARRTRNEGRVRALKAMRVERQKRRAVTGKVKLSANQAERSGQLILAADNIGIQRGEKWLFRQFSFEVMRGDKIGIIGPNGIGKSTLISCLLGHDTPDEGKVKLGTKLQVAYFDQLKATLNPSQTLRENLGQGAEFVIVNGQKKHVMGYLQDFLFTPERAHCQIDHLSGGERSRLLLAKLFLQPSNVLVLDEPTNDLDIETLELLENLLVDYAGTVLLVSHDRAFINNVVTSTLVFEPSGNLIEYIGGYDDWLSQRSQVKASSQTISLSSGKSVSKSKPKQIKSTNKLSYHEQRKLQQLPQQIELLEQEVSGYQQQLADPEFYKQPAEDIKKLRQYAQDKEAELNQLYILWEQLEAKAP